jgi:ankyrin repeat protein
VNTVNSERVTPLICACLQQNVAIVDFLLKQGVDVNAVDCRG